MIRSHLLNMLIYSGITSYVFALIARPTRRERWTYGIKLFLLMTVGSLILAWMLYPIPPL